jgi:hypothetical protein
MRNHLLFVLPMCLASALDAQSVRVMPDIALAAAEYRDAQDAWLHGDPNLERDLLKGDKVQTLRRIHTAAKLREEVMVKKDAYYGLMIQHMEGTSNAVASAANGKLPVEDLKRSLQQQQERLLADQDRLEALIAESPQGDEYFLVRRSLEQEKDDLIKLQNNVAQRLRGLETISGTQRALDDRATSTLNKDYEEILKLWREEKAHIETARPMWARYYRLMEAQVDPEGKAGPAAAAAPAPATTPRTRVEPAGAKEGRWGGTWVYQSQPGAWSGVDEPESVTLELKQSGKQLQGTYSARLPAKDGTRELHLRFKGVAADSSSSRLLWTSDKPRATGVIDAKLSPDGRLLVERISSTDSYVPAGMEVLVRR